jgi:hypothetical protein
MVAVAHSRGNTAEGLDSAVTSELLDGITLDELRGMLILRRAQLEHELEEHKHQLLGVEAGSATSKERAPMPADDIMVKKVPQMGVVAIAEPMPSGSTRWTTSPTLASRSRSPASALMTRTITPERLRYRHKKR